MHLTEINKENLSNDDIQNIVYQGIKNSDKNTTYILVFGNSLLIEERVKTAVEAYQKGKIKK